MITGTRYRLNQEIQRQAKLANVIDRAMVEISTAYPTVWEPRLSSSPPCRKQ